jgi:hypothetical protein
MKKNYQIFMFLLLIFSLISCQTIRRVYNDEELGNMVISDYGFQEFITFKIIDVDTAYELTGERYQNSGIVIGEKNNNYVMLFVPRLATEDPFYVLEDFRFDLEDIYNELKALEDESGGKLFFDPSGDYGGLSLSINPYEQALLDHEDLSFDSKLFFIVTTDKMVFYIAYANQEIVIFDEEYVILN